MKIHKPSYYRDFSCIGGACTDSCCRSWELVLDEHTRAVYEQLDGALGDILRKNLRRDSDGSSCLAFENGACPMLREDGLCALQKEYGEEILSEVCNRYPRFEYAFGGLTELGISLSCPPACRLILETPFTLEETTEDRPPTLNDIDPACYFAFLRGRITAFAIAADRRFSVHERAALLLVFAEALEQNVNEPEEVLSVWTTDSLPERLAALQPSRHSDFRKLAAVYCAMEPLTERYPQMLTQLNGCPPLPDEIMAERLLQYFLYKYFLQAAYDGKLLKKVQLAAASLLLCGALWEAFSPHNMNETVDLIHLYSRELEHSEPNLARFFRWAGKKRQKMLLALLLNP